MYNAQVIEIFIASPSDVENERNALREIILEWNSIHSKNRNLILKPVSWENDVYSDFSDSPQEVINKQIVQNADILIAVFWSKIGSPTENFESGTVEELKTHISAGKPAMVFFSKADLKQDSFDSKQIELLNKFKVWCTSNGVYFDYPNIEKFKNLVRNQISLKLNTSIFDLSNPSDPDPIELPEKMNRTMEDALNFIEKIPELQKDSNKLSDYFREIGNYRSLKLNDFFIATKLLKIIESSGQNTISINSRFTNMSQSDIQAFKEDFLDGDFDMYF